MLYSSNLSVFIGDLPPQVTACIEEICAYYGLDQVPVLLYGKFHVVVPVTMPVAVPTRGIVNGIDIRSAEPMLIQISLHQYPYVAPYILSDRDDFPRQMLPHLYLSKPGEPPALCLVRNGYHEWFANKRVPDLLLVAENWLDKAAQGKLATDGDEYDPLLLTGSSGTHIYQYDDMDRWATERIPFLKGQPFSLLLSYTYLGQYKSSSGLTYRTLSVVPLLTLDSVKDAIRKANAEDDINSRAKSLLSILVWRDDEAVQDDYIASLPSTWGALKVFFKLKGIDIESIVRIYKESGCHFLNGIPIVFAIKRPKKMVGYDGAFQFINFLVSAGDFQSDNYLDDAEVSIQLHLEPFSKALAAKVTGESREAKTLFIGAGSLGSKMIMHDARTGKITLGVTDEDKFLEHNLARHALYSDKVGQNKALATVDEIKAFFESDKTGDITAYDRRAHTIDKTVLNNYNWLVDTTAGIDVLNFLSTESFSAGTNIARAELADDGRLGLLYIEGEKHNPRVDDLVNLAYFRAMEDPSLRGWRQRDSRREATTLSVGLGCSSTTSIIADDTISLHAALFSKVLYRNESRKLIGEKGLLYVSKLDDTGMPATLSWYELVEPFDLFTCQRGSGWTVRMYSGLAKQLISLCRSKKVETGGVLIGIANYKTKTIHVYDIITEPRDSKGTCTGFNRGTRGLPERVDRIKEITGNMIGYIAEWHTHPMNLRSLSETDKTTISGLLETNRRTPIPTCAVIATNTEVLVFVTE